MLFVQSSVRDNGAINGMHAASYNCAHSLGHISRIFRPEVPAGHASISRSLIRRLIIQHNTKPVGPSSDLFALLKVQEIDCAYKHERRII